MIKRKFLRLLFLASTFFLTFFSSGNALSQKKKINPAESLDERLVSLVEKGDLSNVSKAIKEGANVNYVDKKGITPLAYATKAGDKEMIDLLLNNHADINQRLKAAGSSTVLFLPLTTGDRDMAMLLREKGADPNVAMNSLITIELVASLSCPEL